MNVDGYVRFTVDETGEKTWVLDYKANDIQLEMYISGFIDGDATNLINMDEVLKIQPDIKDCLLLVTFSYRTVPYRIAEITEYDDESKVRDVIVLCQQYKETWHRNLSILSEYANLEGLEDVDGTKEIEEWEEFYDEDFEPSKE